MYDCLVIGGGVIGLSLAYDLSRHGVKVRLIDQGGLGREASWAGAGILPPSNQSTASHPLQQLRGLSCELHSKWARLLQEETGIDTGYRLCGGIYLARSVGEAASLHGLYGFCQEEQVAIEKLSADELSRLEPALEHFGQSQPLKACYLLPGEAQIRNPDHLRALVEACRLRGVEATENVEALEFEASGGKVRRVRTNVGWLEADHFCITSGAWSYRLLLGLGVESGILPIRGQMVLFHCRNRPFQRIINEGPRYLVPRDDGHVLVGSTEEEVGFDKSTTEAGVLELTNFAREIVPALKQAVVKRTWAGLRPYSFDGMPYIGRAGDYENMYVAAGHFRSGLYMSPGTAVVLSQLIRSETPEIDLSPFSVVRGLAAAKE